MASGRFKNNNVVEYIFYLSQMEEAARDFCLLIEHLKLYTDEQWLADLARILPRIQGAMANLDDPDIEYSFFTLPDLEERFELYCRLKDRLGAHDSYWLEYDASSASGEMTGSLASDLSDIYFELKRGLNLVNSGDGSKRDVLRLWQTGYILHWGEPLLNAQKHLFSLRIGHRYGLFIGTAVLIELGLPFRISSARSAIVTKSDICKFSRTWLDLHRCKRETSIKFTRVWILIEG
jgi:hypothetical protein